MLNLLIFHLWLANPMVTTVSPPPYVDRVHELHPPSYYTENAERWADAVHDDCAPPEAWLHYYQFARQANRLDNGNYALSNVISEATAALPATSFEAGYLTFCAQDRTVTAFEQLAALHRRYPDRPEAYAALVAYFAMADSTDKLRTLLEDWQRRDPLPAGLLDYAYNQLMSVGAGAVLLTAGDTDTYPTWYLQHVRGVRPDVATVNLPLLLGSPHYRRTLARELNYLPEGVLPSTVGDLVKTLSEQSRPIYLAATTGSYLKELPGDRLYLTGLAFRYSPTPVDNLTELTQNLRDRFRRTQLSAPLAGGPEQAVVDELLPNYLPLLIELRERQVQLTVREVIDLDQALSELAEYTERTTLVERLTSSWEGPVVTDRRLASDAPGLNAKIIDRQLVPLRRSNGELSKDERRRYEPHPEYGRLKMLDTEVSNASYELFLADLLRGRHFDLLDSAAIQPADYASLLPEADRDRLGDSLYLSGKPTDRFHPVTNISYTAARLYAQWLTEVYNADPKRKEERTVRFRLPTVAEFTFAARGGREHAPYPWGGPYIQNSQGCYLSNGNTLIQSKTEHMGSRDYRGISESPSNAGTKPPGSSCGTNDRGYLTIDVHDYYPNDYGLFQMAGNVAEMVRGEGKTMGGSWLDSWEAQRNGVIVERSLPHPTTGFRLVMEVVD